MSRFKTVQPKKISDQVFEQLRDMIFRGQLKPLDQLPPERELAQQMGVSRPTVRNAVSRLVSLGLVEQRQGQGTFVAKHHDGGERNPLGLMVEGQTVSLTQLLEVRLGLECNSAVLAARRANDEDITLLEKSLAQMSDQIHKGGLGSSEDVYFHMRIAYASKNPLQVQLMKHFYDYMAAGIRENLQILYQDVVNVDLVHIQHEKVLAAIKAHDTHAAFDYMRSHINFVIDYFENLKEA
ncbi:MAG: FadR family transcriptional regulator [Desulfarculaceae bacterium]|nr:FadR family transcriptional regulator [Desulfarculaceae bacterium]MCF8049432.1 FadR family transcriptional regulator [Desulfarculaceae bacterium]MCF8065786.1 FadR family transcriptional regulator [Desulfarculaceae bacterium]MCF8098604.1 FadR family transcriptional regulator [Desulfarculaceae bacterium]MCF8124143.1 FadR family transcriptional regulator [Desulfarculaceae bacterium]